MSNILLPKISIIIGVLNMKEYLARTLDSVIKQNYPNLELIIMDGCSTDGTLDVIKQYEKYISFWKSEKDKGHADACNKAIDLASGDLINLLNADDILGEDLLNKVAIQYQQAPQTQMITCGVRIIDQSNSIISEIISPEKLQISLQNILFELPVINARFFHKNIFKQFGKFAANHPDGSYNLSNDRDFLIKLALVGIHSRIIPEPLYHYLSHSGSLTFSNKNLIKSFNEHLNLGEKFLSNKNLSSSQMALFKKWFGKESSLLCLHFLLQGKIIAAIQTAKRGLQGCGFNWLNEFVSVFSKGFFNKTRKVYFRLKKRAI